jgi:hypothetical protein
MRSVEGVVTHGPDNPQKVIGGPGNPHAAPANPKKLIGSSATSAEDDAAEALNKRKAKLNKGRKGGNKGAFDKLRQDLAAHEAGETVTKAMPTAAAITTSKP